MDDAALLRRYLTGALAGEVVEEIELRLFADDEFFALAEAVEREVLADCAVGALAPAEEESVRLRLAVSPEGRARLELAEDLATLARTAVNPEDLLAELLAAPAERRAALAAGQERFHDRGLATLLLERSRVASLEDPARAEEPARLALIVVDRLGATHSDGLLLADLRARAWGRIGNALRVRSDLRGAEEAFATAFVHLRAGTGDPVERGVLLDLQVSLLRAQRRFGEALDRQQEALRLFLDAGDVRRAAASLLQEATILEYALQPERALPVLRRALELIDPEEEPRLSLIAQHNLAAVLCELGRFQEAREIVDRLGPLYDRFPTAANRNRLDWVQGRIARGLGKPDEAAAFFQAARAGFLAEDIPYDMAIVSLELASLYAGQGRTEELQRLAREMLPVFTARNIHREALAALTLWHRAVLAEQAGSELATEVAAYLRRARHNPALRFRETSPGAAE